MKILPCILLATVITASAFAQDQLFEDCISDDLYVTPGTSTLIDCGIQTSPDYTYQWVSQNPSLLAYLSDLGKASPEFRAPENIDTPLNIVYQRIVFDQTGDPVNQSRVSVTVQNGGGLQTNDTESIIRGGVDQFLLDGIYSGAGVANTIQLPFDADGVVSSDLPYLQCASPITVESGALVEIPCTGLNQSAGFLNYHVEFDWPPYSTTELVAEGEFVYMVQAPVIESATSVQTLELYIEMPNVGRIVSEQVEIHVINRAPKLQCQDITVVEGEQVKVPCSITSAGSPRIQILSDLISPEIFNDWPTIPVPEVNQDRSVLVTVRAFGEANTVAEAEFLLNVQQTRAPLVFQLNCTGEPPLPFKQYEGELIPEELSVSCVVEDPPSEKLIWQVGAEAEAPRLDFSRFMIYPERNLFEFTITLLNDVDADLIWNYKVITRPDRVDDDIPPTVTADVDITILEKPNIIITCGDDMTVQTGELPLTLKCKAATEWNHDPDLQEDPVFTYTWEAVGENRLMAERLLSPENPNLGSRTFNVPDASEQDDPTATYTYEVNAETINAVNTTDPPENPGMISVTVINLEQLSLNCDSPIEIFAGDPDEPLSCTSAQGQVPNLSYKWELQDGPSDRLVEGSSGSPPIFEVPITVETTETYTYDIHVEAAPMFQDSDLQTVVIEVSPRFIEIDCDDITVRPGDEPLPLMCRATTDPAHPDEPLDYMWEWNSESGLPLLTGDLNSGMPIFNVPADQPEAVVTYTYMVNALSPKATPSPDPETLTVTIEKYSISLECPEELVVTVRASPQPIECSVSSEEGAQLEYIWDWTPTERLTNEETGSPLFNVPSRQQEYSVSYDYRVTVSAEGAIGDQTSVSVIVLSPLEEIVQQVEITVSELDFGVVGPNGQILIDPSTELISGIVYDGAQSHSGRMMIVARDSVTVSVEQLPSVILAHVDSGRELMLMPQLANSESCSTFSANNQTSRILQISMRPDDCQILRIGGEINLDNTEPGLYSGQVPVALTVNGLDQLQTIPVVVSVEPERRTVLLGPEGVGFRAASGTGASLEWQQSISIQPQVAVLTPQTRSGTFKLMNPSVYPMEVEVDLEFGYREAREDERFSVGVTTQEDVQGDLTSIVAVHPTVVLLSPGETQSVHYGIDDDAELQEQGYAGMFNFTVTPREFINQSQSPTTTNARVTFQAPGIYTSRPAPIQASLESKTNSDLVLLLETGGIPFYGEVIVENESGDQVGRSQVLIYTRSRVRIQLDSLPEGDLILRFESSAPNQGSPPNIILSPNS